MTAYDDVVYDVRLSCFSFVRYLREYSLTATPSWTAAVLDYYEILLELELPDGMQWKDFLPSGLPTENYKKWLHEANLFLDNPDEYPTPHIEGLDEQEWATANYNNGAVAIIPDLLYSVAKTMDLCDVYDAVWPMIIRNYRNMPKLSAPYTRNFPLDWEFGTVQPAWELEKLVMLTP